MLIVSDELEFSDGDISGGLTDMFEQHWDRELELVLGRKKGVKSGYLLTCWEVLT